MNSRIMKWFEDKEPVPFTTRWEKLVGDVSIREAVERLADKELKSWGRLIDGLLYFRSTSSDDWNDCYGETIWCMKPVEGVPLDRDGGGGHEFRWSIGLQYHLYQSPKDRTIDWSYETKDHNSQGDAVFGSKHGTAVFGLTHAFRNIKVSESEAEAELRMLLDAPNPPPLTAEERAAMSEYISSLFYARDPEG